MECDPAIKAIILKIDQERHEYIIEDLDDTHLMVKDSMVRVLKARLDEVSLGACAGRAGSGLLGGRVEDGHISIAVGMGKGGGEGKGALEDSGYGNRGLALMRSVLTYLLQELKNAVSYPDEEDDSDRG